MTRPALPLLYKANAYAAIALGIALILFASQLKHRYFGPDAGEDLIRVDGLALVAMALVAFVVQYGGAHFLAMSRGAFAMAFFLIAPITTLALTQSTIGWVIVIAHLLLILALAFWPDRPSSVIFSAGREVFADWQEEIRETASRQERTRLAEELHDSIKQQLFSIQANLAAAEVRWETDQPAVQEAIGQARASAREAMAETTAMLEQLQVSPLESVGLVEALRRQCEALAFRTGAEVETQFSGFPAVSLSAKTQTAIFRIAQEALSNIGRHARAKHVKLTFGLDPTVSDKLLLRIQDDGRGFLKDKINSGMGFANMRSRAGRIGAELSIDGSLGPGCLVSLRLHPALESNQNQARHTRDFWVTLGLGLLFFLTAWDKGSMKPPDWYPFLGSLCWGSAFIAAAGYSGWRYLQLRRHA
jgi:two-component sensor histidine kinase